MNHQKKGATMKKQIKGRRYNTDTATKLFSTREGDVYLKQSGECFISNGKNIRLIDNEWLMEAVENIPNGDRILALINYYANTREPINVQVTKDTANKLKELAGRQNASMSNIVEIALQSLFGARENLLLDTIEITGTKQDKKRADKP